MRSHFKAYYPPSEEDFASLWKTCTFVPDANALLNVYRYSRQAREHLLKLFGKVRDRLWLPHQAALEFLENRLTVISGAKREWKGFLKSFEETLQKASEARSHPFLSSGLHDQLNKDFERLKEEAEKAQDTLESYKRDDPFLEEVTSLFDGKVGEPFTEERLNEVRDEGKKRYEKKIPPGFADKEKGEDRMYGDLVLWKQILERAKDEERPVIFITDDRKNDWWRMHNDQRIGPHPQLREEFEKDTKQQFYVYLVEEFIEHAGTHVAFKAEPAVIEEAQRTREQREANEPPSEPVRPFLNSAAMRAFAEACELSLVPERQKQLELIAKAYEPDLDAKCKRLMDTFTGPPTRADKLAQMMHAMRAARREFPAHAAPRNPGRPQARTPYDDEDQIEEVKGESESDEESHADDRSSDTGG